jgi:hypothetical protein
MQNNVSRFGGYPKLLALTSMASPMTKCRQARFGVWILDRGYRTPEMRATNGEFAQTFTRFCADLGAVPPARGCWRSGMDSSWLRLGLHARALLYNIIPGISLLYNNGFPIIMGHKIHVILRVF